METMYYRYLAKVCIGRMDLKRSEKIKLKLTRCSSDFPLSRWGFIYAGDCSVIIWEVHVDCLKSRVTLPDSVLEK